MFFRVSTHTTQMDVENSWFCTCLANGIDLLKLTCVVVPAAKAFVHLMEQELMNMIFILFWPLDRSLYRDYSHLDQDIVTRSAGM